MSDTPTAFFEKPLFTALAMNATQVSPVMEIREAIGYCVQVNWAAGTTPVGSLSIAASNTGLSTDFTDVKVIAVSGNTGSIMVNVEFPRYFYVQVTYTPTSGGGTINGTISAKRN